MLNSLSKDLCLYGEKKLVDLTKQIGDFDPQLENMVNFTKNLVK